MDCLCIMNREKWGTWEGQQDSEQTHFWLYCHCRVSQSMSVKSMAHPLPLLPFFHVLLYSQVGLYSIPLDNSLLPSFSISHISLSTQPLSRLLHSHHPSFSPHTFLFSRWSHVQWVLKGNWREKGGQITLQQQISSSGLCVCVRSAGTHTSYQSHEDRLMAVFFSTGPRPPGQDKIGHEQQSLGMCTSVCVCVCWIKWGKRAGLRGRDR